MSTSLTGFAPALSNGSNGKELTGSIVLSLLLAVNSSTFYRAPHEHRLCIPTLIQHLSYHGQYEAHFEHFFLDFTRDFYTEESLRYAKTFENNAQAFLEHCNTRRQEELLRALDVLPKQSQQEVVDVTDKALLMDRLEWLAKNGAHERYLEPQPRANSCLGSNTFPHAKTSVGESFDNV